MKVRSALGRALVLGIAVTTLLAGNALWNSVPLGALKEVDGKAGFGLISLAAGQQARLNVVHTLVIDPEDATSGDGSVRKVRLAFDIYAPETATEGGPSPNAEGRFATVGHRFVERQSVEVTLRAGQATSFDFFATANTFISAVVIEDPNIRNVEDPNIRGRRGIDDPNLRATLEVREGGRSSFVLSPADVLLHNNDRGATVR